MKKRYFSIIVFASLFAVFVRLFVIESYKVTSNSMAPVLLKGDIVLVLTCAFNVRIPFTSIEIIKWKKPLRSEIVVFSLAKNPGKNFIKRVIAIEGDAVEVKDGTLFVNGKEEMSLRAITSEEKRTFPKTQVPKGHFFVVGDNFSLSVDSRVWGTIPDSLLNGKVLMVLFSMDENGRIRKNRIGKMIN